MDNDIKEGRDHMDMTNGFPFKSHATPKEDLDALEETIGEGTMPPLRYKLMHPDSSMTPEEKEKIRNWIDESLKILEE
jgi:hypothetical protein